MKKIILLICILLLSNSVFAANVHYGYNAQGDYVPLSVNGQHIQYSYNAAGDFVPMNYETDDYFDWDD